MAAPSPATVHQAVHDIMAQPRYNALHQGPSLTDLLGQLALRALGWLLAHLFAAVSGGIGGLVTVAAAVTLAGLIVVQVARSSSWVGRRRRTGHELRSPAGRSALDHFAGADRLAAAGDLAAALRELAVAVATVLGGELAWEASPLTVREIFGRAAHPAALRTLLLPFEAAEYGARPPTPDEYRRAAAAAAPYRTGGLAA